MNQHGRAHADCAPSVHVLQLVRVHDLTAPAGVPDAEGRLDAKPGIQLRELSEHLVPPGKPAAVHVDGQVGERVQVVAMDHLPRGRRELPEREGVGVEPRAANVVALVHDEDARCGRLLPNAYGEPGLEVPGADQQEVVARTLCDGRGDACARFLAPLLNRRAARASRLSTRGGEPRPTGAVQGDGRGRGARGCCAAGGPWEAAAAESRGRRRRERNDDRPCLR